MSAALEAMRVGADLAACAIYPVALAVHRVSGESLAEALKGLGLDTGVDVAALWEASEIVDQHIGDEPVTPLAPRVAVRAAEYRLPAGLVAGIDASLRAQAAGDRLDEVAGGALADPRRGRVAAARRADRPDPRLAGAHPRALGAALPHGRRRAARARLGRVRHAAGRRSTRACDGRWSWSSVTPWLRTSRSRSRTCASRRRASPRARRSSSSWGSSATTPRRCCRGFARAPAATTLPPRGVDRSRAERIREIVRVVQESGVGEVTIEESGMRVSVRRTPDHGFAPVPVATTERGVAARARRRVSPCERVRARRGADGRHLLPSLAAGRTVVRRGGRRRRRRARRSASSRR